MPKPLDPDHPQKRTRKRPKAIRAKWQTCPRCQKRINVNDGTGGTHTCYDAPKTSGLMVTDTAYLTGIPCVDESQHTAPYDYTGPERRGLDPFWMHLAADMYLARQRFYRWVRTKTANGIRRFAFRLLRLAYDTVDPNA
jgi:hypothetical protein